MIPLLKDILTTKSQNNRRRILALSKDMFAHIRQIEYSASIEFKNGEFEFRGKTPMLVNGDLDIKMQIIKRLQLEYIKEKEIKSADVNYTIIYAEGKEF